MRHPSRILATIAPIRDDFDSQRAPSTSRANSWSPKAGASGRVLSAFGLVTATTGVGCEVVVSSPDPNPDAASIGVLGGPPDGDPFLCPAWEERPQEDVEALVLAAVEDLERSGHPVDEEGWGDAARFEQFTRTVFAKADCPLPAKVAGQALSSEGPWFCGPGQGQPEVFRPRVDQCLNLECRAHDACYAMCDRRLSKNCYWSSTTTDCDDPFVQAAQACAFTEHRFASLVVTVYATFINGRGKVGCEPTVCPAFREMGGGPCGVGWLSDDCQLCQNAVDTDRCRDLCAGDSEVEICAAARCDSLAQCFGGYGYGRFIPSEAAADAGAIDAGTEDAGTPSTPGASELWSLVLVDVRSPSSKSDGNPWDVGSSDGFAPPDLRVQFTMGGVEDSPVYRSTVADDTEYWMWREVFPPARTAALATLGATVVDVDLALHDTIGDCGVPEDVLSRFGGATMLMDCTPSSLQVAVEFHPVLFGQ